MKVYRLFETVPHPGVYPTRLFVEIRCLAKSNGPKDFLLPDTYTDIIDHGKFEVKGLEEVHLPEYFTKE